MPPTQAERTTAMKQSSQRQKPPKHRQEHWNCRFQYINLMNFIENFFKNTDEKIFQKMGYFDDQYGIMRRYKREKENWLEHLQNTQNAVHKAMHGKQTRTAAVLGSGWWLDVPIMQMCEHFENLHLYDIKHQNSIKEKSKTLKNTTLHTCDISAYAKAVYKYVQKYRNKRKRPPINEIQPMEILNLNDFDFVFSCNILNQLDILLIDYLNGYFDLTDEEIFAFTTNVQQLHIDNLPKKRSLLVADYKEITYDDAGRKLSTKSSVYHDIIKQKDAQRWIWKFDTQKTFYSDRKTFFEVIAVNI
jgi:hypothetical protein